MRRHVLLGGRRKRNKNAAVLSGLIAGASVVIFRKATSKGPIKSWVLAGQILVAKGY